MNKGYTVIVEALRSAAGQAATAGDVARGLALGDAATMIAGALGGSSAAAAATDLATTWDTRVGTWSADVTEYGQQLTESAATYEAGEGEAERGFTRLDPNSAI